MVVQESRIVIMHIFHMLLKIECVIDGHKNQNAIYKALIYIYNTSSYQNNQKNLLQDTGLENKWLLIDRYNIICT